MSNAECNDVGEVAIPHATCGNRQPIYHAYIYVSCGKKIYIHDMKYIIHFNQVCTPQKICELYMLRRLPKGAKLAVMKHKENQHGTLYAHVVK